MVAHLARRLYPKEHLAVLRVLRPYRLGRRRSHLLTWQLH